MTAVLYVVDFKDGSAECFEEYENARYVFEMDEDNAESLNSVVFEETDREILMER